MKQLLIFIAALNFVSSPLLAGPQQEKMKACNAQASGKKGDERKAFMKECLSTKPAAEEPKLTGQQNKMEECNAQASGKKGDERKAFMKECLSKK